MHIPVMTGLIERRILVNYRVEAGVLQRHLPAPFAPKLVNGYGIAGICLIRLRDVRPKGFPLRMGIGSENAAHRFAVTWEADGVPHEGVYIPRCDSSSRLNHLAGGRLFPGKHHAATFDCEETNTDFHIRMRSDDGDTTLTLDAYRVADFPSTSIFDSLPSASAFFEAGALGYSATARVGVYDGLELRTVSWCVAPLQVDSVASSFFENPVFFPRDSIQFDCALLMENIPHEWHAYPALCV